MKKIPSVSVVSTLTEFLESGYDFLHRKRQETGSNVFQIQVPGMQILCVGGEEGVALFYDTTKFQRSGAVPKRVQKTLTGEHAIHTLDGEQHHRRKEMFLSLMSEAGIARLLAIFDEEWETGLQQWQHSTSVTLMQAMQQLLCQGACRWTGVPLEPTALPERAADFTAMFDAFGAVGPRHWRGKAARSRTEDWMEEVIGNVRKGTLETPEGKALHAMAFYRDVNGQQLDARMAAIELINVIRPIVAISTYITFAALALHQHPETRTRLQRGDDAYTGWFVEEVRRYYPFAPFMGALVRHDFDWQGHHFKEGAMVLLDIYGTNHDELIWKSPASFQPDRFADRQPNLFNFIPQGGGDPHNGHRCPGEQITIEVTKQAVRYLVSKISYTVPEQDLSFSMRRLPTFPESGFIMENVRLKEDHG